jgi:hypothetical protein
VVTTGRQTRGPAQRTTVGCVNGREERLALNEAANRAINEVREPANPPTADSAFKVVCECTEPDCNRTFEVTVAEYESVRNDPRRFMVVPEHVLVDIEDVVERFEDFVVVLKRDGPVADIAIQEDPRT